MGWRVRPEVGGGVVDGGRAVVVRRLCTARRQAGGKEFPSTTRSDGKIGGVTFTDRVRR
jgi:hypothetical protein